MLPLVCAVIASMILLVVGTFWAAPRLSKRARLVMEIFSVATMFLLLGLFVLIFVYTP